MNFISYIWIREEQFEIVSQLVSVDHIFEFICECKQLSHVHEWMKKDHGQGRVREEKWRNSGSGIQCQVGRIRRILNRRNPIRPGNGMSSFPSVLSLPKIRGISAIKIRVFDYQRFSRSPFLHWFSLSPSWLRLFPVFLYSTGIHRR